MIKVLIAVVLVLVLAMGARSYTKSKQEARIAEQLAEKKRQDDLRAQLEEEKNQQAKKAKRAEEEAMILTAKQEVEKSLKDPASAQYRNLKVASGVCGEVNAKNSLGGYVGFRRFTYDQNGVEFEPERDASPKSFEFFEYGVFLNCTPDDERNEICTASPEKCKVPSLV